MSNVAPQADGSPRAALVEHLRAFAGGAVFVHELTVPNGWGPDGLSIVIVEPTEQRAWWTFATVGCWQAAQDSHWRSEFVVIADQMRSEHIDLVKMAALFHLNPQHRISLGKVLDVGQPWVLGSACTHLLASLPYPLGPYFEWPDVTPCTRFHWLLPITDEEAGLAEAKGIENLEQLFDAAAIAFADPFRASVAP